MRWNQFCLLGAMLLLPAGCRSLTSPATAMHDPEVELYSDPWISEAGTVARTEHPSEPVNDPLGLRNIFSSEKAQSIERNLGVGD